MGNTGLSQIVGMKTCVSVQTDYLSYSTQLLLSTLFFIAGFDGLHSQMNGENFTNFAGMWVYTASGLHRQQGG